jgi:hypothetical protein
MQVTTRLAARFALAVALLTPSACQLLGTPGPTAVAQGRYYASGNPEYDAFFVELHRLQVELKDSPERTAEPRAALAQALEVGLDADVIKEALTKKASQLNGRQVKFSVQRPASDDKPFTLRVSGSPAGDDAALQKTLEETLAKVSELKTDTNGWQESLKPLPDRAATLERGVDTAFAGAEPRRIAEVKSNLSDGRKVIELLASRASDAAKANDELLAAITGALGEVPASGGEKPSEAAANTTEPSGEKGTEKKGRKAPPEKHSKATKSAHNEPPPKPTKSEPPPKPAPAKPPPKPASKPAPPPKPEPRVAAKPPEPQPEPKPKPAPAEVPPPPKPTQGTAKPDFEP